MGAYVAELIILIAIFAGAYFLLRPLREFIESRLRRWLDRNAPGGRTSKTTINVHPIRPNTPPPANHKDDKE